MAAADAVDVHQHLWPAQLVDRLRARTRTPYLRGWTLHTRRRAALRGRPGAPRRRRRRIAADHEDGVGLACVVALRPARHREPARGRRPARCSRPGTTAPRALPGHFRAWASVPTVEPDLDALAGPAGDRVRRPAAARDRPALAGRLGARGARAARSPSRPASRCSCTPAGARRPLAGTLPAWWAPVVGYTRSCRPPGGAGTPSGGASSPRPAAAVRRRRRAGAGAPRAARRPRR